MDTINSVHLIIHASVNHLVDGSPILAERVRDGDIMIIGAEYSVQTGRVEFFMDGDKDQ